MGFLLPPIKTNYSVPHMFVIGGSRKAHFTTRRWNVWKRTTTVTEAKTSFPHWYLNLSVFVKYVILYTVSIFPDPVLPNILYKFSILKVTENEPINTTIGTRVTSIPGNRLTLTCNVSGLPTPSITWKRNNLLAQKGGSTYTVPSLKASDSGAYSCVATNLAGEAKETSNVFVIGKMYIWPSFSIPSWLDTWCITVRNIAGNVPEVKSFSTSALR